MNMRNDVLIIDDVISPSYQDLLQERMMFEGEWQYINNVAYHVNPDSVKDTIAGTTPGISQTLYVHRKGVDPRSKVVKSLHYLTLPLIAEIAQKASVKYRDIIQSRCFMHFPLEKTLRKKYDNIHTDTDTPHTVFLYYVNNSDGDTYLFDKVLQDLPPNLRTPQSASILEEKIKFTPIQTVSPKKGRVVVFNGNRFHSSSGPTKNVRCILNFNVA